LNHYYTEMHMLNWLLVKLCAVYVLLYTGSGCCGSGRNPKDYNWLPD